MHWGVQLLTIPTKQQRREAAHLESIGVHVVVGHHPHVLEGHKIHGNFLVAYSLGNFLFGVNTKNKVCPILLISSFQITVFIRVTPQNNY